MRKNGFIATSLIYSFFLVFCALLVGYVSLYLHNKNLLDNISNEIKDDLLSQKKISDKAFIGAFVEVPIFSANFKSYDLTDSFLVYSKTDSQIKLVSTRTFPTVNYNDTNNLLKDYRTYKGLYLNKINYLLKTDISLMQTLSSKNDLLNIGGAYLFMDGNVPYNCSLNDACTYPYVLNTTGTLAFANARASIELNVNAIVTGGNGTRSNPFILSYYTKSGLSLHYDALNSNGNRDANTNIDDLSGNVFNSITCSNSCTINNNLINLNRVVLLSDYILNSNNYTLQFNLPQSSNLTLNFGSNKIVMQGATLLYNNTTLRSLSNLKANNTISIINNNGSISLYVNGVKETISNNIYLNGQLSLGSASRAESFKDIRIYNRALNDTEIANNYLMDSKWLGA